jgi:predicted transcriptional regulator
MTLPQHILACLQSSETPLSAPVLVRRCGGDLSHARSRVWTELRKLYHKGLVQKAYGRSPSRIGRGANQRVSLWRLSP